MAFSKKPTQPPDMDTKAFVKNLRTIASKVGMASVAAFGDQYLPTFHRWVRGDGEFDGTGLRDVVNANAYALDAVKKDLDDYKVADSARHTDLAQRVAALEGAATSSPFPASG